MSDEILQEMLIEQEEPRNLELFFTYCIGGGMAFIADAILLYILTEYVGFHYLVSEFFAFICAASINYSFNKKFTFKNKSKKVIRQFTVFIIIAIGGLGLDLFILHTLVKKFGMWYMLAKVFAAGIVLFYNFTGNRLVTFKVLK